MRDLEFSADQQNALDAILEWRSRGPHGDRQALTLGGYAGTGKTTLISHLVETWDEVAAVALCGKAAHVLRSKDVAATTVHSLIYVPCKSADGTIRFRKRRSLEGVQTIIVDEASMIDHLLHADLLSFGLPVLFVGDHGQLEPIGTNANLMVNPELCLEQIHRQAMDNPILRLATAFREGRPVPRWRDRKGRLEIVSRAEFFRRITPDVQILCGFNKTRHQVNTNIRQTIGQDSQLVGPGEKLICLRNNKSLNIFNGQQFIVRDIAYEDRRTIHLEIETDDGRLLVLPCLRDQFGRDLITNFTSKEVALVDYGYCLTTHKSQGSEWDAVLVLEETGKGWDARRWRYTAATRAKKRLIYCA